MASIFNITEYLFGCNRFSDRLLILGPDESLSYAQAYHRIVAVSAWLISQKFSHNDNILLWADNSAFFIIAYFGIMRAGCCCVPIDPRSDNVFLDQVIQLCRPSMGFVQPKYAAAAEGLNIKICSDLSALPACTDANLNPPADTMDKDTAAILFTSGSTGSPRGVMLSHANICYNTDDIVAFQGLTDADIHQVVLPFSYCFGASLLHTHLRVGAALVLNTRFMFPDTVPELVEMYGCTGLSGVPAVYQILCRRSTFLRFKMPSLRFMAQAGGPLAQPFIEEISNAFPEKAFYVMYGQTEATARLSYLPPELIRTRPGSIGCGLAHTRLAVIDENGQPVSPGQEGEIVAFGPNIMLGYYQDPEATATRLNNSCERQENGGMPECGDAEMAAYLHSPLDTISSGYRRYAAPWRPSLNTGDLATVDADGFIYITGRRSGFIKSAGHRISPHRVEAAIAAWENVLEVAVVGVPDLLLGEAIKAIVVPRNRRQKLEPEAIIAWCRQHLPEYMVPRIVEISPGLPRNSSGKLVQKL
ncbi:MAG: AMP-binding protein [Actinobacteria bacterium]|jgi:acyl-CoA synthetase (AMP-forming)/AMP-acid ligase II|nr:AMP-binding protein [Actinomycetota bacterium]